VVHPPDTASSHETPDHALPVQTKADTLLQHLSAFEPLAAQTRERLSRDQTREDQDRSWIARVIIWIFTGSVAAVLAILLLQGVLTNDWDKVASQSIDLVKSTVLPIATLILGYYFGRAGRG
jgi:hypothetical protein